ncbi:MAG TPA: extracellular solute-binding protein [Chloroflexi bacterium]|nr:extracellular solute-binding protein [Chloroflexota bacterium]
MPGRTQRKRGAEERGIGVVLVCLLILLLVTLPTACAPPSTPVPTSPLPAPSFTAPPPTATSTVAAPGPLVVTLTLWLPEDLNPYGEGPEAALLAQQLADFGQAYSDLQVEVIVKKVQGRGGLLDFLRTASVAAPSVLPDLVVLNATDLRLAAQAGLLQPLDGLLPADLAADRFPFAIGLGEVDGQTMGVPIAAELEHLAYRPALLARAPVTWTDVLSAEVPFVFPAAGQEDGVNDATLAQYLGAGGRLTDVEGKPQLEAEPLAAVLDFYAQATVAGVISPTVVLSLADADGCWERFRDWQAGMAVVDSRRFWTEPDVHAAPGTIPTRDGRPVALARGWMLALVTEDSEQQERAMRLVAWLLDPERHGAWTQSAGYLPATLGGLAAWTVTEDEQAVLGAILGGAQPVPPSTVRAAVGPPLQAALEAVLEGRRSPADAAADAVRATGP